MKWGQVSFQGCLSLQGTVFQLSYPKFTMTDKKLRKRENGVICSLKDSALQRISMEVGPSVALNYEVHIQILGK